MAKKIFTPLRVVVLSFIFLIFCGTIFLLLPASSGSGKIKLIDAFFTAVSAVCVY